MKTIFVNTMGHDSHGTIAERLSDCYTNTGNLVWHEYCKRGIKFSEEIRIEDVTKHCENSVLVVPVANNISATDTDFSRNLYKLVNVKGNVVLVGLGVQIGKTINTPKKFVSVIPQRKVRMIKQLAEKCNYIGVRGEYSADCLARLGIKNIKVIGCPSFYSGLLDKNTYKMKKPALKNVCFNITGGGRHEHVLLERILKSGVNSRLIMQGIKDMPEVTYEQKKLTRQLIDKSIPGLEIENEKLIEIYKKARMFFDIESWERYLVEEEISFGVGTRLHGNMITFLQGIPSLWITHDKRTSEVVETLKLPHIDYDKLIKVKYLEALMEKCNYDRKFYNNCNYMRNEYVKFLEDNGIAHNFV